MNKKLFYLFLHYLKILNNSRLLKLAALFICCIFVISSSVKAQKVDTIPEKKHSPRTATIMSAALPGLGQIYNKKYWKVPIIYGAIGGLIYSAQKNQSRYLDYKNAYINIQDNDLTNDKYTGVYSKDNLKQLKDFYKRNRDLSYILLAATYILNILDANVDAHLYYFNVSDKLTLHVTPEYNYFPKNDLTFVGLNLNLTLGNSKK